MLLELPEVTDRMLDALVADMDREGFGSITNYVPGAELERMRGFVSSAVAKAGYQYVGFTGKQAVAGSAFADLADTPAFRNLLKRIYERGTGRTPPDDELYQVLRCLSGETGKVHSLFFHYDSYVVTALIPVEIPREGQAGDLIMLPNKRRIRQSYGANLIDKMLLDNKLTQALLGLLTKARLLPLKRVKMIPGNVYFFWGYRSIHANEACDPSHTRATALFHFANPHLHSKSKLLITKALK